MPVIRWSQLPKAIGNRDLSLVLFKLPIHPRLSLGTFVGNVKVESAQQKTSPVRAFAQRGHHSLKPSARREPRGFRSVTTGMGKGQLACPAAYRPSSVLKERESRCRNG